MKNFIKSKLTLMALVPCVGAVAFLNGCGGGGGGSNLPTVPTIYDGTYAVTYVPNPSAAGKVPAGSFVVTNGRVVDETTFYLQTDSQSVKDAQKAIDDAIIKNGYPAEVSTRNSKNKLPDSITFSGAVILDATGKATLTDRKSSSVCGTGTLTIAPTLSGTGSGTATYQITFPDSVVVNIRGNNYKSGATSCNRFPLRGGTVTFARTSPTPVLTPVTTMTPAA